MRCLVRQRVAVFHGTHLGLFNSCLVAYIHPLSVCDCRSFPPMIAVGSDDTAVSTLGQVHVFEYSESQRYYTD